MRAFFNWRYYVMIALLAIGILCFMVASGEDESPMSQWLVVHIGLFAVGLGVFVVLYKCLKYWVRTGKIT